jgi:hypothetical protein
MGGGGGEGGILCMGCVRERTILSFVAMCLTVRGVGRGASWTWILC